MMKRKLDDGPEPDLVIKRARVQNAISQLSHELVLKILSFLPRQDLAVCHRVSHLFGTLAGDSQLWKSLYYHRFVRPRASRLPAHRKPLHGLASWMDESGLLDRDLATDWKRQYRTRHNWSRGSCAVSEILVAEQASVPPILVQMHNSTVYMADVEHGLRAWSSAQPSQLVDSVELCAATNPPAALSVHTSQDEVGTSRTRVAIGFQDGSYQIWLRDTETPFKHIYTHPPSSNGMLNAISISWPHLTTMTANHLLSLYRIGDDSRGTPLLLHSLRSHTVWPPLTLSLTPTPDALRISIAYALPTYLSGWSVGIQEMRMHPTTGDLLSSRLSSAVQPYRPLNFRPPSATAPPTAAHHIQPPSTLEATQILSKPTSLSYSHPYLLVSHPDNTLTLYLVSSTPEALHIGAGHRLWGHTSSVSGAHIGGRGRAVSVSKRGDELRVWDLEGGLNSSSADHASGKSGNTSGHGKRTIDKSVRIRPERVKTRTDVSCNETKAPLLLSEIVAAAAGQVRNCSREENDRGVVDEHGGRVQSWSVLGVEDETTMSRGWVGFDDENVVVLRERATGGQALVVYDFA